MQTFNEQETATKDYHETSLFDMLNYNVTKTKQSKETLQDYFLSFLFG